MNIAKSKIYEINTLNPHTYFQVDNNEIENKTSLNGKWDFYLGSDTNVEITEIDKSLFKDKINVPGCVEMHGHLKRQYVNIQYPWESFEDLTINEIPKDNYVAIYRKTFYYNKTNHLDIIRFDAVETSFDLFVNGHYVGYSEDSKTPVEFDITLYLVDGENEIIAKVYKYATASWLEDQDFWRFTGIHRDVVITKRDINHISDVRLNYELNSKLDEVSLGLNLKYNNELIEYTAKLYYANKEVTNFVDGTVISNPKLWDTDNPNLYHLVIEAGNEVIRLKVGFRKIEVKDAVIYLNNVRVVFKGINRHDFSQLNGRFVSKEEMNWDISFLKQHNFNSVRTSHYPNSSYFYELCDEYGLLVIDEANLETHGTWDYEDVESLSPQILPNNNIDYHDAVLARAKRMLYRDYNHPSIIMWSCGNESKGGKTLLEMADFFRKEDKNRIVHYEGLATDNKYPDTSDVVSRMYPEFSDIIKYLEEDSSKPYILCEYSHAMGNSNGNIYEYFELIDKYPSFQGGFIWEMFEHTLLKNGKEAWGGDFNDRPNDGNFVVDGLVTGDRRITPKAEYVKFVQQNFVFTLANDKLTVTNKFMFKDVCGEYRIRISSLNSVIYEDKLYLNNNETCEFTFANIVNVEIINAENICIARQSFVPEKPMITNVSHVTDFIKGRFTIGITGENFHHIFCLRTATLASITYNGYEYINKQADSLKPHFWRAATNNDRGASMDKQLSELKTLSYDTALEVINIDDEKGTIITKLESKEVFIIYKFLKDGKIDVTLEAREEIGIEALFSFGFRFNMANEVDNVTYTGFGPHENYVDRNKNMLFKEFSYNTRDQYRYAVPQEYGNRTSVFSVAVYDMNKKGLEFKSNIPFEFSFKEEGDELLEHFHHYGYSTTPYNQFKIHSMMSGVGGDDSWDRWCWDEYIVKDEKKKFNFIIDRYC